MLMLHYDSNSAVASKAAAAAEGMAAVEVVVDEHSISCWPYSQYLQTAAAACLLSDPWLLLLWLWVTTSYRLYSRDGSRVRKWDRVG